MEYANSTGEDWSSGLGVNHEGDNTREGVTAKCATHWRACLWQYISKRPVAVERDWSPYHVLSKNNHGLSDE